MDNRIFCVLVLLFIWDPSPGNCQTERKPVKVTTIATSPYVIINDPDAISSRNYSGFLVDLLDEISHELADQVKFQVHTVKDFRYGSKSPDGQWNGMIGEVIRREADMAMADLTVTATRAAAIDFTVPFMTSGISMMVKRDDTLGGGATDNPSTAYLFLSVFAWQTWVCILVSFLGVSVLHYLAKKFTGQKKEDEDSGMLKEFCLSLSAVSLAKPGNSKKSLSVQFLCLIWKVFLFFAIGLYLSSLTTAMWTRLNYKEQDSIKYEQSPESIISDALTRGYPKIITIAGGSTAMFFKNSIVPEYQLVGQQLSSNPDHLVKSTTEGLQKVKSGGYMFMLESPTNEYLTNRDCELQMLPQLINNRQYAMALNKNSPLTPLLNGAILRLQEASKVDGLKKKWWSYEQAGCKQNSPSSSSPFKGGEFAPLAPGDISGLFYSLIGAAVLAVLAAFTEFTLNRKKSSASDGKGEAGAKRRLPL